jgi:CheY-like chemotaxis protein
MKTVLILEDSHEDSESLRRCLSKAKVENSVEVVVSGAEALAYLQGKEARENSEMPGVIFLDINVPAPNGLQVLNWIRSHSEYEKALVVAVSGVTDMLSVRQAYTLGADSFITKPCRVQDIENLITGFPDHWIRSRQDPDLPGNFSPQ